MVALRAQHLQPDTTASHLHLTCLARLWQGGVRLDEEIDSYRSLGGHAVNLHCEGTTITFRPLTNGDLAVDVVSSTLHAPPGGLKNVALVLWEPAKPDELPQAQLIAHKDFQPVELACNQLMRMLEGLREQQRAQMGPPASAPATAVTPAQPLGGSEELLLGGDDLLRGAGGRGGGSPVGEAGGGEAAPGAGQGGEGGGGTLLLAQEEEMGEVSGVRACVSVRVFL